MTIHHQHIDPTEEDFIVYRGQGLSEAELVFLQNSVEQLFALASFTSTTIDRDLAVGYALPAATEKFVSALFEFHLNVTYAHTRPYAYIAPQSAIPDEYEVLISVGTIFQLKSVVYDSKIELWTVVVHLCPQHGHDIKHMISTKYGYYATKQCDLALHRL